MACTPTHSLPVSVARVRRDVCLTSQPVEPDETPEPLPPELHGAQGERLKLSRVDLVPRYRRVHLSSPDRRYHLGGSDGALRHLLRSGWCRGQTR